MHHFCLVCRLIFRGEKTSTQSRKWFYSTHVGCSPERWGRSGQCSGETYFSYIFIYRKPQTGAWQSSDLHHGVSLKIRRTRAHAMVTAHTSRPKTPSFPLRCLLKKNSLVISHRQWKKTNKQTRCVVGSREQGERRKKIKTSKSHLSYWFTRDKTTWACISACCGLKWHVSARE